MKGSTFQICPFLRQDYCMVLFTQSNVCAAHSNSTLGDAQYTGGRLSWSTLGCVQYIGGGGGGGENSEYIGANQSTSF